MIRTTLLTLCLASFAFAQDKPEVDVAENPSAAPIQAPSQVQLPPASAPHGEVGKGVPAFAVRPGYRVTLAAKDVREARFLEADDKGTVYLSQPGIGKIVALSNPDQNGLFQTKTTLVQGYPTVHGLCIHNGYLWFTQSGSIHKIKLPASAEEKPKVEDVIPDGTLPKGGGHWFRSILVDDDGFYTSIGDASNASVADNDREKIWHYDLNGQNKKLFCSGIRNTEKLRYRPGTKEIYGCDHGSDNFGKSLGEQTGKFQPITDVMPPDELNHYIEGGFYGHPYLVGRRLPRSEYVQRKDILELAAKTFPPELEFGAHWANNGFTFLKNPNITGHTGDMLVAFHGSWNSANKVGYRVEHVMFDDWTGMPVGHELLISALSKDGNVLGRPVDLVELSDGSVLFSVDAPKATIYRITKVK